MSKILLTSDGFVEILASESTEDGASSLPTIQIVGYTGVALKQPQFKFPVVVDLRGMTVDETRTPILINHDENQIAGHTVGIQNDGMTLSLSGVLSGPSATTAPLVEMSRNGYPWQASIGASIGELEQVPPRESITVNGREFVGPLLIARTSTLREISLTPTGVDRSTEAQIAAMDAPNPKGSPMSFADWLVSVGVDSSTLNPDQLDQLEQAYKAMIGEQAEQTAETDTENKTEASYISDLRASAVAETNRISAINRVCASRPEIAAKAINEGWTPEKAELTVLRASRPTAPAIHARSRESELSNDAIVASMLKSVPGMTNKREFLEREFSARTLEASDSKEIKQIGQQGLTGLFHLIASIGGKHAPAGRMTHDLFRAALAADGEIRASAMSELSLPTILGNYANKILMNSFVNVDRVIDKIAAETSLNDFKPHYRVRLTANGIFEEVAPDGEIKHQVLGEDSYTIQAKTYGKMASLSRQDIINDDLSAFQNLVQIMGRAAAVKVEEIGFKLLLSNPTGSNGNAFFSSGNGNLMTGGTSPLSVDSLATAVATFNSQTAGDGYPVLIQPKYLLVPPQLDYLARQLFASDLVAGVVGAKAPLTNVYKGLFEPLKSAFLNNAKIGSASSTAWYLTSDAADVPFMQVGYLNGNTTPIFEQVDLDPKFIAAGFRSYFDFGVGLVDYRAAVKSNGA